MARQLALAVGLVLWTAVPAKADLESGDEWPDAHEIRDAVDAFHQALRHANGVQMRDASFGRRLEGEDVPDISYKETCEGDCWKTLEMQAQSALKTMDSPECKKKEKMEKAKKVVEEKAKVMKKKADKESKKEAEKKGDKKGDDKKGDDKKGDDKKKGGGSGGRLLGRQLMDKGKKMGEKKKEVTKEESSCIFDICKKPVMMAMCANVSGIADNFETDSCTKANAEFLCNSICSQSCTSNTMIKKMLCGKSGKAQGGQFGNDKKGGDLKKMLNMMCMYNAEGDFYCYDEIKKEVAAKKFDKGKTEDKFPDPCTVQCNSTMATTIKNLGCCFPAFMDMQKKYKAFKMGQMREAKATAAGCAKSTAFEVCANGTVTKAKMKQFTVKVKTTCDALSSEAAEDNLTSSLDNQLNLTGAVDMLSCKAKACSRRLSGEHPSRHLSSTVDVDLNIETSGEDADATMATLEGQMGDTGFVDSLTSTAVDAAADAVEETTTTITTTTRPPSAQVSSARSGQVLSVSILASFFGAILLARTS